MTKRIGVVAVFLAGCAVGGASGQFVVPKATAQQAAQLTKWEYFCDHYSTLRGSADVANKLGAQGWEMAGVVDGAWCFKRPKM